VLRSFGARVRHSYIPYDLPGSVARFLRRIRPGRLVIIETEIWPNLFYACRERNIPIVLANARLSKRSFRGYARVSGAIGRTLAQCSAIAAQSKADAKRFRRLGAPSAIVGVMGNLKYDVTIPPALVEQGRQLRAMLGSGRPVWVAASTHEGEEASVLAAHRAVVDGSADAVLILIPRHPERFDQVWELIRDSGFIAERKSRQLALARGGHPQSLSKVQVFLGDSMGEMFLYLAAGDLAFVGGSLVAIGGHNVLEPAALGLPVLFGPYMSNFMAARSLLLRAGAALEISSDALLAGEVAVLLGEAQLRETMGEAGARAVAGNRGALKRLLTIIDLFPARTYD
jgi:3-deoxy-D-manno-octulosonic-acid transferase